MKQHALITELQLGKTVEELCEEHFKEYEFEQGLEEYLPSIVKGMTKLKKPLRIVASVGSGHCCLDVLGKAKDLQDALSDTDDFYWDDDGYALDDDARHDAEILNEIMERLFGWKRNRKKPKISSEEYLKNTDICPFCLKTKPVIILDDATWTSRDIMGCRSCGETWSKEHKKVITGFSAI